MSDPGTGGAPLPPPPGWQPPPPPPPSYARPPPPGWAPPPPPLPSYTGHVPAQPGQVAAAPWVPAPGMLGAAHKPGALPLRPLGLGDMYDAAFRIIRFNPRATVGSAVLVAAVAMALPVLATAVFTWAADLSLDRADGELSTADTVGAISAFGSYGVGSVLQSLGLVLVTGMIAHVTAAAAVGRRLSLREAWRAAPGKRWRLLGLALLIGLMVAGLVLLYALTWIPVVLSDRGAVMVVYGVVTVPAFLALLCWFYVRVCYLPVPALMLEPVGVGGALRRAFALTRRQFWRTFGIALLTRVVTGIAGSLLSLPITLAGQVVLLGSDSSRFAVLGMVVSYAAASVVSAAFVAPFTTAVTSVQYLDQRMRKEAYDVELMARAGIPTP